MREFFRTRSVVEIMVFIFTMVIAISVIATGAIVAIVELVDHTVDTSRIVDSLTSLLTGLLGALLGLLAGKSDAVSGLSQRPGGGSDGVLGGEDT